MLVMYVCVLPPARHRPKPSACNVCHHGNLLTLLVIIVLVNAQSINPQVVYIVVTPQSPKRCKKIPLLDIIPAQ